MSLVPHFKTGLYSACQSFSMLWHQKKLLLYFGLPALIGLFARFLMHNFLSMPLPFMQYVQIIYKHLLEIPHLGRFLMAFGWIFLTSIFLTFFAVALIYHANQIMKGQKVTIGKSLCSSLPKINLIILWALQSTVVDFLITLILANIDKITERYLHIIIALLIIFLLVAWFLYTFFVLTLITLKNDSFLRILQTSGIITKSLWAEILGGEFWFFLVILLCFTPIFLLWLLGSHLSINPLFVFASLFTSEIILRAFISTAHTLFKLMLYLEYEKKPF